MRTPQMRLSRMGTAVEESATLRQAARAAELRAQGRNIYNLTVGEPDGPTPGPIVEDTVSFMKKAPFADAGFAFFRSAIRASRFSFNAGVSKSARPIGQ